MDALVLAGGSIKGGYQAGAISAVLSAGFKPDIITGTSVGAINTAALAAKEHLGWPAAGEWLARFWFERITGPGLLVRRRGTLDLLWRFWQKRWRGFVDVRPLEKLIRDTLDADLKMCPKMAHYRVSAFNLRTGMVEYHGAESPYFLDAVMASAMEPVIMPARWIGTDRETTYVDGGVEDIAPLKQAIVMGATRIFAVLCQPAGIRSWHGDHHDVAGVTSRLLGRITDNILEADLKVCAARNGEPGRKTIELAVARPPKPLPIDLLDFDADTMRNTITLGKADGLAALRAAGWAN
jgi:NTE family protein